jgi:PAS domain S-box-containing protein
VDAIVVDGPQGSRIFTLQSPEEPYRILAERMNEGAATLGLDGTVLFCNRRLAEMLGTPAERLVGSLFCAQVCPEEQSRVSELLQLATEQDIRTETRLLRSDRTQVPVQLSLSHIPVEDSGKGICLVASDLSDQKAIQEQVRQLNAELEHRVELRTAELMESNKELEAFSYAVAHDLRTPLRHIHGFSDILAHDSQSSLSADGQHCLDCILKGVSRMQTLVEHLLSLSRLARQPLTRRNIDLNSVVRETIEELAGETSGRQMEWRIGELSKWHCDAALVKTVFANLLSNAVKFTRDRSPAVIEVGQILADSKPVLFVRDNGVGFDMKYADKLFGMFQRLHTDQEFPGTGVGLATVRRIVQKHGGQVWAKASVDEGATFYFTLADPIAGNAGKQPERCCEPVSSCPS